MPTLSDDTVAQLTSFFDIVEAMLTWTRPYISTGNDAIKPDTSNSVLKDGTQCLITSDISSAGSLTLVVKGEELAVDIADLRPTIGSSDVIQLESRARKFIASASAYANTFLSVYLSRGTTGYLSPTLLNIDGTVSICYIKVSGQAVFRCQDVINAAKTISISTKGNPSEVLAPIPVIETGTTRLLELLEKIYRVNNDNFYVCIRRATEASDYSGEAVDMLKRMSKIAQFINDSRTELLEARKGIKDLLGLDEKFYPDSVSNIEISDSIKECCQDILDDLVVILDRVNAIHQSENDALFEIRTRVNEIKTIVTTIETSTTDIKQFIKDQLTISDTYARDLVQKAQDNILAYIQQVADTSNAQYVDLVERISAIDTSVGR